MSVCDIIIKRPFSGLQLTIFLHLFTEIRYFLTVCSVLCVTCPREINLLSKGILLSNIGRVRLDH